VLRRYVPADAQLAILSFGCSTGEELVTLRRLFPGAQLFGCDIDWSNLAAARVLLGSGATVFASSDAEIRRRGPYDVIVCNSVLLRSSQRGHGHAAGIDPSQWLDTVALLDSTLRPGGILQIINSNIPFRYHPVASSYLPLRSPLILGPGFVDQFDLNRRPLCRGVPGTGFSAMLGRHFGDEGWRDLRPSDFHDVHFWKPGPDEPPGRVEDEILPNLAHGATVATGTMTFRPAAVPASPNSTYVEVDVHWTATGVDTIRLKRIARRVWFDGSTAWSGETAVDLMSASATVFLESCIGRRSTRLAMDAVFQADPLRVANF